MRLQFRQRFNGPRYSASNRTTSSIGQWKLDQWVKWRPDGEQSAFEGQWHKHYDLTGGVFSTLSAPLHSPCFFKHNWAHTVQWLPKTKLRKMSPLEWEFVLNDRLFISPCHTWSDFSKHRIVGSRCIVTFKVFFTSVSGHCCFNVKPHKPFNMHKGRQVLRCGLTDEKALEPWWLVPCALSCCLLRVQHTSCVAWGETCHFLKETKKKRSDSRPD